MMRQIEGFAIPSDAESSTYDVILLSPRLGARPNPLQIGNTPSFTSGSPVIRKRSEPVFGGISTYKAAWRLESGRKCPDTIPPCWRGCTYQSDRRFDNLRLTGAERC